MCIPGVSKKIICEFSLFTIPFICVLVVCGLFAIAAIFSPIKEFNNVDQEAILFVSNYFKKINPFEYIENYKIISKEYLEKVLKEAFKDENSIKSCIKPQKNS